MKPSHSSKRPRFPRPAVLIGAAALLALVYTFGPTGLLPSANVAQATTSDAAPVVVELFTSQSCYSCPPAEAYLGELKKRPGVIALEYHVDYWDDLIYWTHGKWKDPFSSPAHTRRQQEYNLTIRGRGNVYTPQMVIGGRLEAVGSRRGSVETALTNALRKQVQRVNVAIDGDRVRLDGMQTDKANVVFVEFLKQHTTEIKRGENHGKTLTNHNVVLAKTVIGDWQGDGTSEFAFTRRLDAANHGCAVLVQKGRTGHILGAGLCP